jgi:hypothetical protein
MVVKQFRTTAISGGGAYGPRIFIDRQGYQERDLEGEYFTEAPIAEREELTALCSWGPSHNLGEDDAYMWEFPLDGVNFGKACELLLKAGYVGIHVG